MTFVSIPEERFMEDVLKTWIEYFKTEPQLAGLNVTPKQPDETTTFSYPSMVVTRIAQETFALARVGWYYRDDQWLWNTIDQMRGYRFMTTYQFSLYEKTQSYLMKRVMLIHKKLKSPAMTDPLATHRRPTQTVIPVLDYFPNPNVGVATDLEIRFRYQTNVNGKELPNMDNELHQYAFTVSFRIDYLKAYNVPMIMAINFQPNNDIDIIVP